MGRLQETISQRASQKGKRKEVTARAKLKALVRKVVDTSSWLVPMLQQVRLPPQVRKASWFTLEEKLSFLAPEESRSEEMIDQITKKLYTLMDFIDYNIDIVRQLVRSGRFLAFGGNRTLYEADKSPRSAYLILEGSVWLHDPSPISLPFHVLAKPLAPVVDPKQRLVCKEQKDMVGDQELVRGERRKNTAFIQGHVEMICFDEERIMEILKPTILRDWENKLNDLRKFRLFRFYDTVFLKEVAKLAKYVTFRPSKYIKMKFDKEGNPETVYFLLFGKCQVIQRLLVVRDDEKKEGFDRYKLYYWQEQKVYPEWVEAVYMRACSLQTGAFFGIGERMSRHHIFTESSCRFITLPNKVIRHIAAKLHTFTELVDLLNDIYPTTIELFIAYVYGRCWHQFSRNTPKSSKKPSSNMNNVHNAPLTMRASRLKLRGPTLDRIVEQRDYLRGRDIQGVLKLLKARQKQRDDLSERREYSFAHYKAPYVLKHCEPLM